MLILLLAPTTLFLHLNVSTHWRMASDVESQLHSLVLADNGIEYARTLLPLVELNPLLLGPDGNAVIALFPMVQMDDGTWRMDGCVLVPATGKRAESDKNPEYLG